MKLAKSKPSRLDQLQLQDMPNAKQKLHCLLQQLFLHHSNLQLPFQNEVLLALGSENLSEVPLQLLQCLLD